MTLGCRGEAPVASPGVPRVRGGVSRRSSEAVSRAPAPVNESGEQAFMLNLFAPGAPREEYFETLGRLADGSVTMSGAERMVSNRHARTGRNPDYAQTPEPLHAAGDRRRPPPRGLLRRAVGLRASARSSGGC